MHDSYILSTKKLSLESLGLKLSILNEYKKGTGKM